MWMVANCSFSSLVFKWGWKVNVEHSPVPKYATWVHEKGYTYCLPCYGNHIYHSVEGMGQVLSKLFSPASFPYVWFFSVLDDRCTQ